MCLDQDSVASGKVPGGLGLADAVWRHDGGLAGAVRPCAPIRPPSFQRRTTCFEQSRSWLGDPTHLGLGRCSDTVRHRSSQAAAAVATQRASASDGNRSGFERASRFVGSIE